MAYRKAYYAHNKPKTGIQRGYKSGLEDQVAAQITSHGLDPQYEAIRIPFEQPAQARTYRPDFLLPNGIVIESKGRFTVEDRKKHVWLKEQLPDLDLRFVFSNPNNKINKNSKTTYAMWCEHNGFLYSKGFIPDAWFKEPANRGSLRRIKQITGGT